MEKAGMVKMGQLLLAWTALTATPGFAEVDAKTRGVLEQLEAAGQKVRTIECRVIYSVEDRLNLTKRTKHGTILFRRADPHPMFLVRFEKTIADDVVLRHKEWWVFRDRWLTEAKAKSRTVIQREILAVGEQVDLFDPEKSRVPMPFGQKVEQILASFDVKLMPPQKGDPEKTDHLYCTPKAGTTMAGEVKRLEYFVSQTLHLPVRIVSESADGAKITVASFPGLSPGQINLDLGVGDFKLPPETKDFNVTREPLTP
jgi:hypothetical protein